MIFKIITQIVFIAFAIYFLWLIVRIVIEINNLRAICLKNREWRDFVKNAIEDNISISTYEKKIEYLTFISENLIHISYDETIQKLNKIDDYKREIFIKFGPHSQVIHDKYLVNNRESKLNKLLNRK